MPLTRLRTERYIRHVIESFGIWKTSLFWKNKGNIKREYSKNDKKTKTYITHSVRNNPNNTSLKKGNIETTKDTLKVGVIAELFGNNPKNIPLIPFLKRNFIL